MATQFAMRTGEAVQTMANLNDVAPEIAKRLADAENLVIIAGAEGVTLEGSQALMQACANFLIETDHFGKADNGLMSTAPTANAVGLHYLGFSPNATQEIAENPPKVLPGCSS